jgi:dihydrofolate synthase/folylpolyglutamate synthase
VADGATSADPAVQAQLDRLWALSPGADVLGLGRITRLLARIGNPHLRLPPVFHVAGTNGKGSTCAFLRAMLEAQGYRVHAYTSPHLVRFNERVRLAGRLITDAALAPLLAEVLDAGGDIGASFFEVTTAAAFLAFARTPADVCVIEVGLGGRLDATNVLAAPAACGIAALGIDHEAFLLAEEAGTPAAPLSRIGFEKAGIAKRGAPLVTQAYPAAVMATVEGITRRAGAVWLPRDAAWRAEARDGALRYADAAGALDLPLPMLAGAYQADNAALAVAMLRHQHAVEVSEGAIAAGISAARWPARLQRLGEGPLARRLPAGTPLWLDGGHNPSAGEAVAAALGLITQGRPLTMILGMLANKDAPGYLAPLAPHVGTLVAVPVPHHASHAPDDLARIAAAAGVARTGSAPDVATALSNIADATPSAVLIAGSLYLAGEVLRANDEAPD